MDAEPAAVEALPEGPAAKETSPVWSGWREALRVVGYRPHLIRTIGVALIVGTILFCINQLDVVIEHRAGAVVWLKVGLTYVVPFCVSNIGILVATRRGPGHRTPSSGSSR
jgi:hypothetical protein